MSEINVTPLVDVMLVLLIIFMVAAPLIEKERTKDELQENRDKQQRLVALNLPVLSKTPPPPEQKDDVATVKLSITDKLVVSLEGKQLADCSAHVHPVDKRLWNPCWDKTEAALIGHQRAKDYGVTIDASPSTPFGFVVGVVHRIRKAEIDKVGMLPKRAPQ